MADFKFDGVGQFKTVFTDKQRQVAKAATDAVRQAAQLAVDAGRKNIAAGGLSRDFQTGYRFKMEEGGLNPSAIISDKLGFISVFEDGEQIQGKPLLWIPLSNLPTSIKRLTPKQFAKKIAPLHSIVVPGRPPMLGAALSGNASRVTVARLKSGGKARLVPIFIGVPSINVSKRISLRDIDQRAADQIGVLFASNLKD